MGALSTYITQVRQLLHDPNGQMWPDSELTSYINQARNRVAGDSYCLRQLDTGNVLVTGQEKYNINATVSSEFSGRVLGVIGIDLYWGNTRYPLWYASWTKFSTNMRFWTQMQQRPTVFTMQGALTVYVGYTPDQDYVTDWDIAINPRPLVNDQTVEELVPPFIDRVQWWAAHLAKFKEQALGEADLFEKKYKSELLNAGAQHQRFVVNPLRLNST